MKFPIVLANDAKIVVLAIQRHQRPDIGQV